MARRREFDPAQALAQARERFHGDGFAQASMQDLLGDMGIGQGSFYATFGSKEALFRKALDDFAEEVIGKMVATLRSGGGPKEAVCMLLSRAAAIYACDPAHRGCFLVNTTVERGPHDEELREVLRRHWERVERALVDTLTAAREQGKLAPGVEPRAGARLLLAVLHGMAVRSKHDPRRKPLEEIASAAATVLF